MSARIALCFLALWAALVVRTASATSLDYSTYIGGTAFEQVRGIAVDAQGNIVLVGGTGSSNFPVTFGPAHAGNFDVFIVKLNPSGQVIWSRFLGGPNYDRAYNVEVDALGNIYVGGRCGAGFPTTAGALQTIFGGDLAPNPLYGPQDGFVAKLNPQGQVGWATYYGGDGYGVMDDLIILPNGNIAFTTHCSRAHANHHISANAYQRTVNGGNFAIVGILNASGTAIVAATYFGGSGSSYAHPCIAVDGAGQIYLLDSQTSTNLPTTPGAVQPAFGGGTHDLVVAKFSPDLSALLRCTYFGGNGKDYTEGFTIAVDAQQRPYLAGDTDSNDLLRALAPGVSSLRRTYQGSRDAFVAILSADFSRLDAGTYLGGSNADREPQGLHIDAQGNVLTAGTTNSANFPLTTDAHQSVLGGGWDVFITVLAPDLSALSYSTLLGGNGDEASRFCKLDNQGNILSAGQSSSSNFPTLNPIQMSSPAYSGSVYRGGTDNYAARIARGGSVAPPVITTHPANQTVTLGQAAAFSVTATGTPPLSYQWQKDGAPIPGATGALYTTPATTTADSGSAFRCIVSNSAGSVTSNLATLAITSTGPFAHWKFDETSGASAADATGNNNTGTLINGPVWAAGKLGGALHFDGSNDAVRVNDNGTLDITNSFTFAAWINPETFGGFGYGRILAKGTTAGSRYSLFIRTGGYLHLKTSIDVASSANLIQTDTWQHVAVSYDSTTLRMYKNGVQDISQAVASTVNVNTEPLYIGNVSDGSRTFNGLLDDLRIYNRALSAAEIAALANSAPPSNLAPVANAGPDLSVEPGMETLSGSGSDPDSGPSALTYTWTQISGPATVGISNANQATASVAFAAPAPLGAYVFSLAVNDGSATATDTMTVNVIDSTPPSVDLPAITLKGIVNGTGSAVVSVTVNEQAATVAGNTWSKDVTVNAGTNLFTVVATDGGGETNSMTVQVTK